MPSNYKEILTESSIYEVKRTKIDRETDKQKQLKSQLFHDPLKHKRTISLAWNQVISLSTLFHPHTRSYFSSGTNTISDDDFLIFVKVALLHFYILVLMVDVLMSDSDVLLGVSCKINIWNS